ncbi:MAG: hypothetical protein AABX86_00425 [Nanoarchaeota archaeon]
MKKKDCPNPWYAPACIDVFYDLPARLRPEVLEEIVEEGNENTSVQAGYPDGNYIDHENKGGYSCLF